MIFLILLKTSRKNSYSRLIPRPTAAYIYLLRLMVYFDSSSDGTDTQCLLYNELDGIGKFLESEVLQLLDYNILAHYYNLDSKSIFSYKGVEEEDFYKLTFMVFYQEYLKTRGDVEMERNIEFIKESLTSKRRAYLISD